MLILHLIDTSEFYILFKLLPLLLNVCVFYSTWNYLNWNFLLNSTKLNLKLIVNLYFIYKYML